MSNILTKKIYHEYQSFSRHRLFYKRVHKRPEVNVTPKRKNNNFKLEKTSDTKSDIKPTKTTENVARYVRRKDTYPVV